MKKKTIVIAIFLAVFGMVHQGMTQPRALIEAPVFTFASVPEGNHVSHEFKIKNMGDTVLHIHNVSPP